MVSERPNYMYPTEPSTYDHNYFVIDGVDSRDFGIFTNGYKTDDSGGVDFTESTTPGRDGSMFRLNQRKIDSLVYEKCWVYDPHGGKFKLEAARDWLQSLADGEFHDLTDSYHPDIIRKVMFSGDWGVTWSEDYTVAQFELTFKAQPRRYLVSGTRELIIDDTLVLTNTGHATADPTIIFNKTTDSEIICEFVSNTANHGKGLISRVTLLASAPLGTYEVNCETRRCYCVTTETRYFNAPDGGEYSKTVKVRQSADQYFEMYQLRWPALYRGKNTISFISADVPRDWESYADSTWEDWLNTSWAEFSSGASGGEEIRIIPNWFKR